MPQQLPLDAEIAPPGRRRALALLAAALSYLLLRPAALGQGAASQGAPAGDAWLRRAIERATDILTTPGTDEERRLAFGRLLAEEVFDFQAVVRFVLGNHWAQASEAQRSAFADALLDYLIVAYARLLRRLFAGTIDVFASRAEKDGLAAAIGEELARAEKMLARTDWSVVADNDVVLLFVQFKPREGEAMRTMLRVIKRAGGFRILDIWVNGVSLARTHRDDIAGVIRAQSGDLNGTIAIVRRKARQLAGS
jgi:ABC-type transporter MlaC component